MGLGLHGPLGFSRGLFQNSQPCTQMVTGSPSPEHVAMPQCRVKPESTALNMHRI